MLPRTAALSSLTVLTAILLTTGCGNGATATPPPAGPAVSGPASTAASSARPSGAPAAGPVALPGTLVYIREEGDAPALRVRMTADGLRVLPAKPGVPFGELSPDGRRLAWVDDDATLNVGDADGRHARRLLRNVGAGYGFDPVWSADSTRILTGVSRPGQDVSLGRSRPVVVRVADGSVTDLPAAVRGHYHYRWSGDGRELFFVGPDCSVMHARADGTLLRTVPVLGSPKGSENPQRMRACDVLGVNADASRIAVDLHVGDEPDGDIAGSDTADTIIDVATGQPRPLPVRGTVLGVVLRPDGTLLVRSLARGVRTLTLFGPADELLATLTEPAALKSYALYDHTR